VVVGGAIICVLCFGNSVWLSAGRGWWVFASVKLQLKLIDGQAQMGYF
jgi:hypothetical protein